MCNSDCKIDCVDILELAIEKLYENAKKHTVSSSINGIVSPIENFTIKPDTYDLIIAVSALEHINSEESFINKLFEIKQGLKKNGIVCLIINSNVKEKNKETQEALPPQFEVNLATDNLVSILNNCFNNHQILKKSSVKQNYEIPRDNTIVSLSTDVITFVAKNV